ncbi:hypothetical protein CTEN210_12696 [Chaetoceros tenuissimus]|uniref:G-protein coupled receptors family 1 profile domain-containing protein n=1 Tax=Chaetoceros tenuissimus TaxID=426638 RepID=A0AAD3D3W0_9STRA|nr:hypothetical protein CTEN210_12696 [Chaetoceros tenuissimus]
MVFLQGQIIKEVASTVSLIASGTIITMIVRNKNGGGLKSPYSRIIFGLSFGDVLFSLGFIFSPIAAPKDTPDNLWAAGNTASCEFVGFLFNFMSIVPFYSAFLTYYFYKRVVRKVSRSTFAYRTEVKLHVFIWMYTIVGGFVALGLDYFNPSRKGSMCLMIEYPLSCHSSEDPDACERGNKWTTPIGAIYQVGIPTVFSFFCILVNLSKFTYYIWKEERMILLMQDSCVNTKKTQDDTKKHYKLSQLRRNSKEVADNMGPETRFSNNAECLRSDDENASHSPPLPADEESWDSDQPYLFSEQRKQASNESTEVSREQHRTSENEQQEEVRHDLAKRALVQSFLYITSFLLAYFVPLIGIFHRIIYKSIVPDWIFVVISIFSPLGGFFNVLIYTRPKIHSMRKLYPCYKHSSWIKLFFLVIFSGGEVPDEIADEKEMDVRETRSRMLNGSNNRYIQQQRPVEEEEEEGPVQVGETELKQYDNLQPDWNSSNDLVIVSANADELANVDVVDSSASNNERQREVYNPEEDDDSEYQGYYHYQVPPSRRRVVKKEDEKQNRPSFISSSSIGLVSIPEGKSYSEDLEHF